LTSIAGLSGSAGLLRKTASNTWTLDTNTYLTELSTVGNATNWDTASRPSFTGNALKYLRLNAAGNAFEFATVEAGVSSFISLTDTPSSYSGYDETYYVRVKSTSDGLEFATVPSSYTLPVASADVLGGVKIGDNLSIDGSGVLSAVASPYELPTASADTLGGVKIGSGINITDGVISVTGGSGGGSELTFASGETEVTLPGTPSNGQIYEYVGTGDVWTITANAGQTIRLLGYTGNTLTAEHPYACVGLVFFDNVWIVRTQVGTLDLSTV